MATEAVARLPHLLCHPMSDLLGTKHTQKARAWRPLQKHLRASAHCQGHSAAPADVFGSYVLTEQGESGAWLPVRHDNEAPLGARGGPDAGALVGAVFVADLSCLQRCESNSASGALVDTAARRTSCGTAVQLGACTEHSCGACSAAAMLQDRVRCACRRRSARADRAGGRDRRLHPG